MALELFKNLDFFLFFNIKHFQDSGFKKALNLVKSVNSLQRGAAECKDLSFLIVHHHYGEGKVIL